MTLAEAPSYAETRIADLGMFSADRRSRVLRGFGCCLGLALPLLATPVAAEGTAWIPQPLEGWSEGLKPLQSGRVNEALRWFQARQRDSADEVCGAYFPALVYAGFDVAGLPDSVEDLRSREWAARGIEAGQRRLDSGDADASTRYCLGALYGLRATDRMMRSKYLGAALDGKRARRIMLDLVADEPQFVDCHFWLGSYDYFADVLPKFFKFFRSLLFFPGGDRALGLEALDRVAKHGRLDRFNASWILHRIYDDYENEPWKGVPALERLRRDYPDFVEGRLALAWHHAVTSKPPDRELGIAMHLEALERAKAIGGTTGTRLALKVSVSLAQAYINDLQPDAAVEVLREMPSTSLGWYPVELRATLVLARALNHAGEHESTGPLLVDTRTRYPGSLLAAELEKVAMEFDSRSSRIFHEVTRAWRLGRDGRLAEAKDAFRHLAAQYEDAGMIELGLAEMHFEMGRYTVAKIHYRRVLEAETDRPTFLEPWARLRLGNLLDLDGEASHARASYRKAEKAANELVRSAAKRFLKFPYTGRRGVRLL